MRIHKHAYIYKYIIHIIHERTSTAAKCSAVCGCGHDSLPATSWCFTKKAREGDRGRRERKGGKERRER